MVEYVSVSCPMDCPDLCRFSAHVEDGRILKLVPDRAHPLTRGFSCKKGLNHYKRMYHPARITKPLVRKGGRFEEISCNDAMEIIQENLPLILKTYGPEAVINYSGTGGYGGLKDRIQTIFFNRLGGATVPAGSLCWGAGLAAQAYDFGSPRGHDPDDILNSEVVLLWGRNPKYTNPHLYALLKKAQKKGCRIIVIDPIQSATARAFDEYIRINPSTDAAFALGMARFIIQNGLHDSEFIKKNVIGFKRFEQSMDQYTPEHVESVTGVSAKTVIETALLYAKAKTASIYIGFGLQRYHNGGSTIRCIDALGSITGRIGKEGGGVNYAAKSFGPYLFSQEKASRKFIKKERSFTVGRLGEFLEKAEDPPVKAIFVHAANPLNQSPDLTKTIEQFKKIEFKVVFEHFLTDTARHADLVIPAAFSFEQEDFFVTGMYSPILNHSLKAVEPPDEVIPEFDFFLQLADKMGISDLEFKNSDEYLKRSAAPFLEKEGLTYTDLVESYPRVSGDEIPWQDGRFATPSGKIELYSEKAEKEGLPPLPAYLEASVRNEEFPLRLLSCHANDSLHSQGFAFEDRIPEVFLCKETAEHLGVGACKTVWVKGQKTSLKARLVLDESVNKSTAFMYQGWWHKSGAVNFLTDSGVSDMGGQAAYYDSFCTITPCG